MVLNREPSGGGRGGQSSPMFNAPGVITALIGAMIAVHVLRITVLKQWEMDIFFYLSVIPAKFWGDQSVSTLELVLPLFSHIFLHADAVHVGFNSIWLLALGTPVARRLPTSKFLTFFFACGVLGAFSHVLLFGPSPIPMIGASGAVSGLMGAAVRFALFVPGGYQMAIRYGSSTGYVLPISDRRVLTFSAVWVGLNLVFGLVGGLFTGAGQSVAWDVHIAGYVAGLLLFPMFDPRRKRRDSDQKPRSHLRRVK